MLTSTITPTDFINNEIIEETNNFTLALSHLIDDNAKTPNRYTEAIIKSKNPVYLDNWVFENGKPEWIKILINKLMYLNGLWKKPQVVFAPDELYEADKTFDNFIEWKKEYEVNVRDKVKTLSYIVIQWNTKEEFIDLVNKTRNIADWIALSYLACVRCFKEETWTEDIATNRIAALKAVNERLINRNVHLLWLWDSLKDLEYAKTLKSLKITNDSSSAFMLGSRWIKYNEDLTIPWGKIKEKVNFNEDTLELWIDFKNIIEDNILFIKNIKWQ